MAERQELLHLAGQGGHRLGERKIGLADRSGVAGRLRDLALVPALASNPLLADEVANRQQPAAEGGVVP
jgi:hypothetical protein